MKVAICGVGVAVLLLGGCRSTSQLPPTNSADTTSIKQAKEIDWRKAGVDAQTYQLTFEQVRKDVEAGAKFYDVRSKEEYDEGRFEMTDNLPIDDLEAGKLPDLPKDTTIYVHCLKGIRSAQATKILREAGFSQVYDLGGVEEVEAIGGSLRK